MAQGDDAEFTAGKTALLISRQAQTSGHPETLHSDFRLFYPATGETRALFSLPSRRVAGDFRYSLDGLTLYVQTLRLQDDNFTLAEPRVMVYSLREHKIVRSFQLNAKFGCPSLEMLPSGTRALFTCDPSYREQWTVVLAAGQVTHRSGPADLSLHGRLTNSVMLGSGLCRSAPEGDWVPALGTFDISTSTTREIAGTCAYSGGVAAYDVP